MLERPPRPGRAGAFRDFFAVMAGGYMAGMLWEGRWQVGGLCSAMMAGRRVGAAKSRGGVEVGWTCWAASPRSMSTHLPGYLLGCLVTEATHCLLAALWPYALLQFPTPNPPVLLKPLKKCPACAPPSQCAAARKGVLNMVHGLNLQLPPTAAWVVQTLLVGMTWNVRGACTTAVSGAGGAS